MNPPLREWRKATPRRQAIGLVAFITLAALAWLAAPRPDVLVLNATPTALSDVRVCIRDECETRETLEPGDAWHLEEELVGDSTVTLTHAELAGQPVSAYASRGQRVNFRVREAQNVEVQVR